jgi:hypothetical protein
VVISILIVVLAIIAIRAASAPAAAARHFVEVPPAYSLAPAALRTVVIGSDKETLPNMSGTDGILMATLVSGQLPSEATRAIVRTDSNCQPDPEGVSHCLNQLEIGSQTILLRHDHKMSITPCLTPGETVYVMSLKQYARL